MKHVDALSQNPPIEDNQRLETVLHIHQVDWILSGQLTDARTAEANKKPNHGPREEDSRLCSERWTGI